jgi:SPP1 family predicted phage head-tail adaptor
VSVRINAGALNKRILFLRFVVKEDDMGQDRGNWEPYKKVWATVKPYKSSECNFMGKMKPEVSHRIYVRFRKDVTAEMRILYHGRMFQIAGPPIDLDEKHELLEIQCEEVFENAEYQL